MKGKKIKGTLLIAVLLITTLAIAINVNAELPAGVTIGTDVGTAELSQVQAYSGTESIHLDTGTVGPGDEARIVIQMAEGFTLGDLNTISWKAWTVAGYPAHVDIILGADVDGIENIDSLTAESNMNPDSWLTGSQTYGAWLETFEYSDSVRTAEITTTNVELWLTRHGGGPGDADHGTLAEWVADNYHDVDSLSLTIDGDTPVLRLEIEVDNWILDTEAYIDDIEINGELYQFEPAGEPMTENVTGAGSILSADADTSVVYTGADADTIVIEDLAEDEVDEATFGAVGEYVDVQLEVGTDIDTLQVRVYYDDPEDLVGLDENQLVMYWFDGDNWVACSDTGVNIGEDYVWADITTISSPSISQMTGTEFGPGDGMILDAEYYHTGDTVTVMLGAADQNDDPEVIETVALYVFSMTDDWERSIAMIETGIDTGVFSGTFKLVGVSPGAGELLVSTGDDFYVEYWNAPFYDCIATVDDTAPVVLLTAPAATVLFEAGDVTITATIDEDNPVDVVIQANSAVLAEILGAGASETITWDTLDEVVDVALWPDGTYTITVTAIDAAGNFHSDSTTLTVDNTGPTVTDATASPTIIGLNVLSNLTLTAVVEDAGIGNITSVNVDCSDIGESASLVMTDPDLDGVYNASLTDVFVTVEDTYELNITAIDDLLNENSLVCITLEVIDDVDGPTGLAVTEVDPISGGMIVKGFSAVDALTGVVSYDILEDGASWMAVTVADLAVTTWTGGPVVFNNMVVLEGHAGETVNVTLIAYDQVGNPSEELILYEGVIPEGEWAPIVLSPGWNLVSLPLIPDSSDSGDVMSLILDQGAAGVVVSYAYDHYTDTWTANPAEMTDGYGYWLYAMDEDVMIVEGTYELAPPSPPATYEFTAGWVLAGYKSTTSMETEQYMESLEADSYFATVYIWDAAATAWNTLGFGEDMSPGQGFWIWMYSDQNLIPPMEGP